jgi:hypothetical protein
VLNKTGHGLVRQFFKTIRPVCDERRIENIPKQMLEAIFVIF